MRLIGSELTSLRTKTGTNDTINDDGSLSSELIVPLNPNLSAQLNGVTGEWPATRPLSELVVKLSRNPAEPEPHDTLELSVYVDAVEQRRLPAVILNLSGAEVELPPFVPVRDEIDDELGSETLVTSVRLPGGAMQTIFDMDLTLE